MRFCSDPRSLHSDGRVHMADTRSAEPNVQESSPVGECSVEEGGRHYPAHSFLCASWKKTKAVGEFTHTHSMTHESYPKVSARFLTFPVFWSSIFERHLMRGPTPGVACPHTPGGGPLVASMQMLEIVFWQRLTSARAVRTSMLRRSALSALVGTARYWGLALPRSFPDAISGK